jgi:hypothetical protein
MVDVHGVIKIDTCNVDTVTENLYIPRVVDQAGRIVTPARGEVVARLEWPPGIPVLCAPSLLIKFQGQILARPPYIRPRPSRMAANGSTKTLARQPLRAWVHEYKFPKGSASGEAPVLSTRPDLRIRRADHRARRRDAMSGHHRRRPIRSGLRKKRFVGELRLQLLAIGSMKHRRRAIRQ